jgi:hypothetical protein
MPASASRSVNRIDVYWVNSSGRRNTSSVEVSDGQACGVDDDADGATGDALAGVSTDPS